MTSPLPPLLVALPLACAAGIGAFGRLVRRPVRDLAAVAVALAVTALAGLLLAGTAGGDVVTWAGGWLPRHGESVGVVLAAGPVGAGFALLTGVLTVAALVYSWRYYESLGGLYHALVLVFLAGADGFALTGDLFDMFVFFELMSVSAYVLTAYRVEAPQPLQGAINFAVSNTLGASLVLTGIGLLYARTGELGLAQIGTALRAAGPAPIVVAAFVLVSCGWLVKAAAVPFHFWCGDAHAVAPTPVCVLFSGVMDQLGVYALARTYWVAFSPVLPVAAVRTPLLVLGALTAVVGAVMCVSQQHLKRLLAFSTISHIGLFLFAVGLLTGHGMGALLLYVAGHALVKGALFLATGLVLTRFDTVSEPRLHGRGRRMPVTSTLFLVGGLALSGLPPFAVMAGKSLLEDAAGSEGLRWVVALVVLTSAVTGAAVLKAWLRVFRGAGRPVPDESTPAGQQEQEETETQRPVRRPPVTMLGTAAALLVGGLALGVLPGAGAWAARAGARFVDRAAYVAAVLHGVRRPLPEVSAAAFTVEGVALGLVSVTLAVALAAALVWPERLGSPGAAVTRVLAVPVGAVRAAHSGRLGDYVTWLVTGVALVAAMVGLSAPR